MGKPPEDNRSQSADKILKLKSPKTTMTTTNYRHLTVSMSNKRLSSCVSSSTVAEYTVQGIHQRHFLEKDRVFIHTLDYVGFIPQKS